MNKKILIPSIILIIIIGIICGIVISKNNKKTIDTNAQKQEENVITNEEVENITNELIENEIEEDNIIENTQTTTSTPEEPQETAKTDSEKAIEIVKKDYGTSGNIKFNVEGTDSNGKTIVVVRDIDTTAALKFYHVDIANGTFIKE